MQRSRRRLSLAVATVLTLTSALAIVTAPAASANRGPDLSSRAAIDEYLISIGVDPSEAVWQEGLRNYAGASCPGVGWNCVPANAPTVQIGPAGARNLFSCQELQCVAVQVLLDGGQNSAACERRVDDELTGETIMVCDITQASGTGANAAGIAQHIQQTRGLTQKAREIARITQVNETGSNIARIIQGIGQSSRTKGSDQVQEAHQAATVTQTTEHENPLDTTTLGDNTSNVSQTQDQLQRASGGGPLTTINQDQNTEPGTNLDPFACDPPGGPYNQQKNQCAQVTQHSSLLPEVGGANRSVLRHDITQRQTAENAGIATQAQGFFSTGEGGTKEQLSSGVSTSDASQSTVQVQTASGVPEAGLSQTKTTGDPRCCQLQMDNLANHAEIIQTSDQFASSPNASQLAVFQGHCESSGTCHVLQSATINGEPQPPNECTGSICEEFYTCTSGEGEPFCFDSTPTP